MMLHFPIIFWWWGQMGCGKSSFVQSLGKNKMLDNGLLSVDWVSKINLKNAREDEIKKYFEYTKS